MAKGEIHLTALRLTQINLFPLKIPTMSTNFLKKYLSMLQQIKPILTPIDQKRMKATTQNIKDK